MRTFAVKQKATQQATSAKPTIPNEVRLASTASPRFAHDFSRIHVHPPAAGAIQTKLTINKPGDKYEQEAEQLSDRVMRMESPGEAPMSGVVLQSKGELLLSDGRPLDPSTRSFMEPRFGYDLSKVRIYFGHRAAQSARSINALAYTTGNNIVFGEGQYQPGTNNGRKLLAHELTHVVQQVGSGMVKQLSLPSLQRQEDDRPADSASGAPPREAVIVLGRWDRRLALPGGGTIRVPSEGSRALLRREAIAVFPGSELGEVMELPGAFGTEPGEGTFGALSEEARRDTSRAGPPGWRGLPSGVAVQEALEGGETRRGYRIRAIFINVDEVDLEHGGHTSSEYRQIVAALASGGNTHVDIVIRHGAHTSIVRRGARADEGDPLPAELRRHLPPTFRTLTVPGSTGGDGGDDGGGESSGPPSRRTRADRSRRSTATTPVVPATPVTEATSESASSEPRTSRRSSAGPRTHRGSAGRVSPGDVSVLVGAGASDVAMDIAEIYLQQWIQEQYYDPANRAEFESDFTQEQPRIERMVRRRRAAAQRIRASGGVAYAVVTLHVVYRSFGMPDGLSHSSFQDLWVENVDVASAPREGERGVYEGSDPLSVLTDLEALGRNFREENHTLVTYSYEIPDTGYFARLSMRELAEALIEMHQYLVRITTEVRDLPAEAVGVAREMRQLVDRSINFDDLEVAAELQRELTAVAESSRGVVSDIIALLRAAHH